jgi:2-polyprenyl-3-methyl-5-hydroxy-6-metoxy-1,4-benzoquinol methylase
MNKPALCRMFRDTRTILSKQEALLSLCSGKRILDVGCVGQDAGPDSAAWLHNQIRSVSATLVGTDLDRAALQKLRALGYDMLAPEELSRGGDFEVIVLADVLEHVDDPVALLRNYRARLAAGGVLVVTTPNPFAARQTLLILTQGTISVNEEHTMWIDPRTMAEICRRSGLTIERFAWLTDYYDWRTLRAGERLRHRVANLLIAFRRYFAPNLLFVLRPDDERRG